MFQAGPGIRRGETPAKDAADRWSFEYLPFGAVALALVTRAQTDAAISRRFDRQMNG